MPDRDPLQTLWTKDQEEPFTMSLAEIRTRATKFQSRVRTRNVTEYAAAALVIGIFGWMAFLIPDSVVKAGAALVALGALYVCWKLHTLARAAGSGDIDRAASLRDFHRAELVRQREALATVWRWYLAPFLPGTLLFVGGVSFSPDAGMPFWLALPGFLISLATVALIFGAVLWLNHRAVKQLDAEIAEMD